MEAFAVIFVMTFAIRGLLAFIGDLNLYRAQQRRVDRALARRRQPGK
jgi:hypothetical protein